MVWKGLAAEGGGAIQTNNSDMNNLNCEVLEESELTKIEYESSEPFQLFKEWYRDARNSDISLPSALCLSTVSSEGTISARTLLLRRVDDDGFVVMTDSRSRKAKELSENPHASMVFFWNYKQKDEKIISRQVRINGHILELETKEVEELYNKEPLYCKIRSHICHQGQPINWQTHKDRHDQLLTQVREGKTLPMPDHVVGYKLVPDFIEFYYALGMAIGDRLLFKKIKNNTWETTRLYA